MDFVVFEVWVFGNFDVEFLVGLLNFDLGGMVEVLVIKVVLIKS